MLGLALLLALTQTPQHRLYRQPNLPRSSYAFFEFAPENGTGMGAACACTTPTGAKGETMTFTRASSGTCLKGGTTSGIANGDMATCTNNQPRVMPGGDGTGGLGLLVEGARTNSTLRSQEFDNAAWSLASNVVALPTVTANAAVAPDGTTTAERVQVPSSTGGQYSQIYQTQCPTGDQTASVFIKGVSGSGTFDLAMQSSGTTTCATCTFVAGSWTRCVHQKTAAAGSTLIFGSNAVYGGNCLGAAADVYLWGAQCETGSFPSSYIATAGAAVTRARDAASFTGTGSIGCESYEVNVPGFQSTSGQQRPGNLTWDANNYYDHYIALSGASAQHFTYLGGVVRNHATSNALTANAWNTMTFRQNGTTLVTVLNGTTTSSSPGAYTIPTGAWTFYPGNYSGAGFELGGVVRRVQLDPASTRCR